jgi:adenosine deaminase CECR1
MHAMRPRHAGRVLAGWLATAAAVAAPATAPPDGAWFEQVKSGATPTQLYTFLYALPKGGDLHNHLPGGDRTEWLLQSVLSQADRGYVYYTRVRIDNCAAYGHDEFGGDKALLLFKNIQESRWRTLTACQQGEFRRLQDLDAHEKAAWLDSQRLESSWEGRDEFFNAHFDRVNDLLLNPWVIRDILLTNMQAFAREGVVYLELMQFVDRMVYPDGSPMAADEVVKILRDLLASPEARATGVTLRFQDTVLRFAPDAEELVRRSYAIVDRYRDLYVGLNLVGREDNDKGYPLRFLPVMREMRHKYPEVHLSIHAGEVDEPNRHVRDTLLLGAERIGHGVNLITDPDTMRLMRNGPYLVEINLVSNLLLEYVSDYSQHPFGEYLRTGIPVALSTDDRGMWDSNLTDEYYVAVKEFNLSWNELVQLGRNSLAYSFLDAATKAQLLADYERRVAAFAEGFRKEGWAALRNTRPETYGFICRRYRVCITR